jgi:adenylate cyclase
MATEIERKFVVSGESWRRAVVREQQLQQGYLSSNAKATVRVRIFDDRTAVITLKGKTSGMSRAEFEYAIPLEDARELLEMARPNVIEKRRFDVAHDGLTWEVDVFEGRHAGLVLAEIELASESQSITMPDWAGAEVTADERYFNATLARSETMPGA